MPSILLKNNKGFQWYSSKSIFVKGCFFDTDDNYYEKESLISFFTKIKNNEQFIEKVKTINGIFTVLIQLDNKIFIASDTTRIFPLFYAFKKNSLNISDDIEYLKEKFDIHEIDKNSSNEFLASGYTLGNKTLLKDVYTLQSNEYIIFDNDSIEKQGFFFSYATNKLNNSEYTELKKQAIVAFENAFGRLIKSLNNRMVVLPLSGGFDSRFIAVMLKKYNYKNVICYTYGKKDNFEIQNSKKTAEALDFKWVFIEYSEKNIENYLNSEGFKDYTHYVGKYSSMPFLQEYFAVKHLSSNNRIPSDSIFIPGHSGDLLGGSQFVKIIPKNLTSTQIPKLILSKKFYGIPTTFQNINKIDSVLSIFNPNYNNYKSSSVFEDFDIKEKITKVIFNSSCVYPFFNYEFRFPFWDKELLTFFKSVPTKYKKMKWLYDDILMNNYFELFDVNFDKEIQPSIYTIYKQNIKNQLKLFFPYFMLRIFLLKNDWLNSEKITDEMILSMRKNKLPFNSKIKTFNEINIQWYLYYCKDLIKK